MTSDKTPKFSGKDQNGYKISLADYKEKIDLIFHSEAGSPTCTIETCNQG